MPNLIKKSPNNVLNALKICIALPGIAWTGIFLGGTYLSFLGSLSCVAILYLMWVFILRSSIRKTLLTKDDKIYWAPIILRLLASVIFDFIGLALIVPFFMKLAVFSLGYEDDWMKFLGESEGRHLFWPALQFMNTFQGSFYATLIMGLYISLQYFIIAYTLFLINKYKPLEK